MKHLIKLTSIAVLAAIPAASLEAKLTKRFEQYSHVPNQLLVKLKPGPIISAKPFFTDISGLKVKHHNTKHGYATLEFDEQNLDLVTQKLQQSGLYEYVEKNYVFRKRVTPNDPNLSRQWYISNTTSQDKDLDLLTAWDIQPNANNVLVAVIDDGFDLTHPDLTSAYENNGKCFASDATYCGGNTDAGFTAADQSHGTRVTGTFAATANNNTGIAGVSWGVKVLPLKSDLTSSATTQAIDEAISQGATIINMSFGGPVLSQTRLEAYQRAEAAGILLIAAAGNSDSNTDLAKASYPANAPVANMISVAASDSFDNLASWTQWGPSTVDLAAPGAQIYTTTINSGYGFANGTSFASPITAGIAALIKQQTNDTGYKEVKAKLLNGGTINPTIFGRETYIGRTAAGRLDANKALSPLNTGVILINSIEVDDSTSGNNNGLLDPGETADLMITLENIWTAENNVVATLSTNSSIHSVISNQANLGTLAQDATVTARFTVSTDNFIGNQSELFDLAISSDNGDLQTRSFYFETSKIIPGQVHTQKFLRWGWDEYHAFHIDVPQGASNLEIKTTSQNSIDIDLLVKYQHPPEYDISLNPPEGEGIFYTDSATQVSGNADGTENVTIASPQPGTYHIVVINFDQTSHDYTIEASFDAPSPGVFNVNPTSVSVDENAGTASITIERSGTVGAVTVDYTTQNGTATSGSDYTASSGTLNWADGESSKTITVPIIDDTLAESDETFQVVLSNATGGASIGANATAQITINANDNPGTISFSASTYTVSESTASITITVSRSGGSANAASVDFATADGSATAGSDYTATNGTLNWNDGETGDKTFTVSITSDTVDESNETVTLSLSNASGASLGGIASATLTINDDDTTVAPPPTTPPSSGGGGGSMGWLISLLLLLQLVQKTQAKRKES